METKKRTTAVVERDADPFGAPYVLALAVIAGPDTNAIYRIVTPETKVGRDSAMARFVLKDTLISGEHFIIRVNGALFSLIDLGSTNGTLVNGQQVKQGTHARLKHMDEIQAGRTKLLFLAARFRTDPRPSTDPGISLTP